jgi:hypothetical protein
VGWGSQGGPSIEGVNAGSFRDDVAGHFADATRREADATKRELSCRGPCASGPLRSSGRRMLATRTRRTGERRMVQDAPCAERFTALKLRLIRAPSGYLRPT